jgi:hypothetical protein
LFQSFSISPKDLPRILVAAAQWMALELSEGWRSWFGGKPTQNAGNTTAEESPVRMTAKA